MYLRLLKLKNNFDIFKEQQIINNYNILNYCKNNIDYFLILYINILLQIFQLKKEYLKNYLKKFNNFEKKTENEKEKETENENKKENENNKENGF